MAKSFIYTLLLVTVLCAITGGMFLLAKYAGMKIYWMVMGALFFAWIWWLMHSTLRRRGKI
jgi:hypothetical protein